MLEHFLIKKDDIEYFNYIFINCLGIEFFEINFNYKF